MTKKSNRRALRFAGVQAVKRDDGRIHYYHRRARVRLPDEYGSPEFAEAWAAAERSIRKARPGSATGSFGELVAAFEASEEWQSLAPRTRADYAKVRDWLFARGAGRAFTRDLDQAGAERILDAALQGTNWRFSVYVLQYCRRVWNWSQEKAIRKKRWGDGNPWRDIPAPKRPRAIAERDTNRPWTPRELAAVLERAPQGLRRAYVLGACGFDGGTMTALLWSDYDDAAGVFSASDRG